MSMKELTAKVAQLRELRRLSEELAAEITWKPVTSSRLDSKTLKAEAPDLWTRYSKQTTARRFVLA